jgi:hypothetical protein
MNAVTHPSPQTFSLMEVIQLKWMLAGEGVHLHVERLMADPVYADQALQRAAASTSPTLRAMALRLRLRLASTGV